jgi:HAD superfamily hydrolase (TIGR01549 family)
VIKFDAVVFDFDGVLLDSVDIKTRAFASLYSGYGPSVVEQVVTYHMANGGISRFEKFRYFHNKLLGIPISKEEECKLADKFNELVEKAVITAPWIKGAEEFLKDHHDLIPLFVASGTPEEELVRILNKRGMSHYFKGAFGSPKKKGEILRNIINSFGFSPKRVLMVGDSTTDLEGAVEAGVCFLGISNGSEHAFPPDVFTLPDLTGLRRFVDAANSNKI